MKTTFVFASHLDQIRLMAVGAIFLLVLLGIASSASAGTTTDLVARVNEALRMAGLPVTPANQQSFANGVLIGRYDTFNNMVADMKFHKENSMLPAKLTPVETPLDGNLTSSLRYLIGYVQSRTDTRLNVRYEDLQGQVSYFNFIIVPWTRIPSSVKDGTPVKVFHYFGSRNALDIRMLAPKGMEDFFGPVDCKSCPGRA